MNLIEEGDIWVKYFDQELIATNPNRSYVICYIGLDYISVIETKPLPKNISFNDAMWKQIDIKSDRFFGYNFTTEPEQWLELMKKDEEPSTLFKRSHL